MSEQNLPPLPLSPYLFTEWVSDIERKSQTMYTADQMHSYALEALSVLQKQLDDWDRVLRASVPDQHKGCFSPVGAVQNYIAELETQLDECRADAERLRWIEAITHKGFAPAVIFDDDGNWAVSFTGSGPMCAASEKIESAAFTHIVEADEWRETLAEAIDAARASLSSGN